MELTTFLDANTAETPVGTAGLEYVGLQGYVERALAPGTIGGAEPAPVEYGSVDDDIDVTGSPAAATSYVEDDAGVDDEPDADDNIPGTIFVSEPRSPDTAKPASRPAASAPSVGALAMPPRAASVIEPVDRSPAENGLMPDAPPLKEDTEPAGLPASVGDVSIATSPKVRDSDVPVARHAAPPPKPGGRGSAEAAKGDAAQSPDSGDARNTGGAGRGDDPPYGGDAVRGDPEDGDDNIREIVRLRQEGDQGLEEITTAEIPRRCN
jgi:hypothetical protein